MRLPVVLLLPVLLAACGSPAEDPAAPDAAPASAPAQASADGKPATFAQCVACHAVEAGKNGIGPSLAGVAGAKAGTVAAFSYSDALRNSGLTWDDATMDKWLEAPMKTVPGTRMSYAGMPDPAKRQEMIAYLKTLK